MPSRIVTNEEIAPRLGVEPEYIFKSSGIRRRRWAQPGTTTSSLAAAALREALNDAQLETSEIDYLILGTMTPDRLIPGSAPAVQSVVGLREIPCLDIRASCCNVLYGLQIAKALVASGAADHVAIAVAEIQSIWLAMSPAAATLSMLFGDGAAAIVVSNKPATHALEILDVRLATNGSHADALGIRRPGTEFGTVAADYPNENRSDYLPRMNGQTVILHALRAMSAASEHMIERNGVAWADVRWVVPHQANSNLLTRLVRQLSIQEHQARVINILDETGNTGSASMGIALDTLRRKKLIRSNDHILLPAFGAGFTWGAGLCRAL